MNCEAYGRDEKSCAWVHCPLRYFPVGRHGLPKSVRGDAQNSLTVRLEIERQKGEWL